MPIQIQNSPFKGCELLDGAVIGGITVFGGTRAKASRRDPGGGWNEGLLMRSADCLIGLPGVSGELEIILLTAALGP